MKNMFTTQTSHIINLLIPLDTRADMSENPVTESHHKPKLKEAKRRANLFFKGCVLRTLSSITHSQLTSKQEDAWLSVMEEENSSDLAINVNAQQIADENVSRLSAFIKSISADTSTPIGSCLSQLTPRWGLLSPAAISSEIFLGSSVALLSGENGAHICHLGSTADDGFISVSDNNRPVTLNPNINLCIVFSHKTD